MPDTVDPCVLCRQQDVARRIARLRRLSRPTVSHNSEEESQDIQNITSISNENIQNIASMTDQELMEHLELTDEQRMIIMKEQQNRIESRSNPNQKGGRKKRKTNKRKKKRSQTKKNKRRVKKKSKSRKNRR